MDAIKNPFSPGAGSPPPELVGRSDILEQAAILIGRIKNKKSEKSMLLTGLRGVGKTVLLNEMERLSRAEGYKTVFIESHETKSLGLQLVPHLRTLLFELDRIAGAGDKAKRALAVLKSFLNAMQFSVYDLTFGLDIEPEKGSADSGDIEVDLPNLLIAVAEAAQDRNCQVAILIDEIHNLNKEEISALIRSMHKIQQRQLPVTLMGAGLPILPGLAGESKSYAERLFNFPVVGALTKDQAFKAISEPALRAGLAFDLKALEDIYNVTQGYPYFIQEWGYYCWNIAEKSPITLEDVQNAYHGVLNRLDKNFFKVRFDRLVPSEKRFVRAMAELEGETFKIGDISEVMAQKVASLGPVRSKLIKKGMIYSPSHGDLAFTVPLFGGFLKRAIPQFERNT